MPTLRSLSTKARKAVQGLMMRPRRSCATLLCACIGLTARAQIAVRAPVARVVGVYDEATGKPIAGAEVRDLVNGRAALTTPTGTVDLFFVDTSGSLIRVRKIGYEPLTLLVANSPRDTMPVTLVLKPVVALDPVISIARRTERLAGDTVGRLERVGFYNRRHVGQAPWLAFVTQDQILHWKPRRIADIGTYSGRPLCVSNLWLDGAKLPPSFQNAIDPSVLAGVETYVGLEVPPEYGGNGCVTLAWTKDPQ